MDEARSRSLSGSGNKQSLATHATKEGRQSAEFAIPADSQAEDPDADGSKRESPLATNKSQSRIDKAKKSQDAGSKEGEYGREESAPKNDEDHGEEENKDQYEASFEVKNDEEELALIMGTKEEFANETFSGPMHILDQLSPVDGPSLEKRIAEHKEAINSKQALREDSICMIDVTEQKFQPNPYESPERFQNPDYQGHSGQNMLSTASFKIVPTQSSMSKVNASDFIAEPAQTNSTLERSQLVNFHIDIIDEEARKKKDESSDFNKKLGEVKRSSSTMLQVKRESVKMVSSGEKMTQAAETFSANMGGIKVKGAVNANMISYQTANFGAINQSMNTITSAAFGGADQNETGDHIKLNLLEESESRIELQVIRQDSQTDNEGQVLGMGLTVRSNLSPTFDEDATKPQLETVQEVKSPEKPQTKELITDAQREIMTEQTFNWQLRTATIDDIHVAIMNAVNEDPEQVLGEAEELLDFFIGLLNDQNFKIVLMTLSIVNLIIGMPQHFSQRPGDDREVPLSTQSLGKHIPRLIGKLADSKNIIRSQAIRALISIFTIMRFQTLRSNIIKSKDALKQSPMTPNSLKHGGPKISANVNNFVPLVLPYLLNSNSWHVREELLHVLIICFLKTAQPSEQMPNTQGFQDFDPNQILETLLKMFDDQKKRIQFTAVEAIVAFVNISNKQKAQQIIYQFASRQIGDVIMHRLQAPASMDPYLNENGRLEMPYLEHVEKAQQYQLEQQQMNSTNGRREGLNSGPPGQIKNLTQNSVSHPQSRGNSSSRKYGAPPSANSIANAAGSVKRTASANNPKQLSEHQQQSLSTQGHVTNQSKFQSPMYNAFESGVSQRQQTSNALSDFCSAVSTANGVASSKRNQISRQSNDRTNTSSFLPQLNNQNSFVGNNMDTPSQQHFYHHSQHLGASAGPHNNNLQGLLLRGPPASENRLYQNFKEASGSFYNQGAPYQRKVSANSQHQIPMPLKSRGSGGPQGAMLMSSHNLSNHPINQLKGDHQPPIASNMTDPVLSPQQPGFNELMSRKHKNLNSVDYESLSDFSNMQGLNHNAAHQDHPNFPPGFYKQSSISQHQQQLLQQPTYPDNQRKSRNGQRSQGNSLLNAADHGDHQTQSSYYSHSRGVFNSYSQVSNADQFPGPPVRNQELIMHPHYQHQILYSGGSMGEGPLQSMPTVQGNVTGISPLTTQGAFPTRLGPQQLDPTKYSKSGNTFYSDKTQMTHTTTSTQVANQLKQKQLRQKQLAQTKLALAGVIGQSEESITDSMGIFRISSKGPVKARQLGALKHEDSSASLNKQPVQQVNQAPAAQPDSLQELCIDSRRPKRPIGSTTYDIDSAGPEAYQSEMTSPSQKNVIIRHKKVEKGRISNLTSFSNNADQSQKNQESRNEDGEFATASFNISENDVQSRGGERLRTAATNGSSGLHTKVTYIKSSDLKPIEKNAERVFQNSINDLTQNPDWTSQFEACNTVRSVCVHHSNLVLKSGQTLHHLVKQLCKLADSLRSSLVKIALITVHDMFTHLKSCMEPYLDLLLRTMLKKVCDTSAFISDEARSALLAMTTHCSDRKVLMMLLSQSMKNSQIRLHVCHCLTHLVSVLGNNILFFKDSDKLISQLALFMKDANQEVRTSAKSAFVQMSQAVMGKNDLEKLLQRVLSEVDYKKIKSFLESELHQTNAEMFQSKQHDFVIRNANQGLQQLTTVGSQSNSSALQKEAKEVASQQQTVSTPHAASSQGATIAPLPKQTRTQGGPKGTLRTGSLLSNKMRESQDTQQKAGSLQQSNTMSIVRLQIDRQKTGAVTNNSNSSQQASVRHLIAKKDSNSSLRQQTQP